MRGTGRTVFSQKKRVMGIEPTPPAWEAGVLPLNYTRMLYGTSPKCYGTLINMIVLYGKEKCNWRMQKNCCPQKIGAGKNVLTLFCYRL
jgi:hypothetical protein